MNYTITYNRSTRDYDVYVAGQYIGSRDSGAEAETLAFEYLTNLARLESRKAA